MTFSVYVRILMIVQATQLLLVFISLCHIYSCTYVWGDWGGGGVWKSSISQGYFSYWENQERIFCFSSIYMRIHQFQVYNDLLTANLSNITIYKKESIPDSYHLKNHRRTPPIVIEPDNGIAIVGPWKCNNCTVCSKTKIQ